MREERERIERERGECVAKIDTWSDAIELMEGKEQNKSREKTSMNQSSESDERERERREKEIHI